MDGTPGLQSGTLAGRYTIERELGRGATATVYLARDAQRGHAVAIKVLRQELSETLGAERFLREIRMSERLHHPHIASVLDSGEYEGKLYFVLPHMEGGSLRQLLQREKQLSIEVAVSITRTVALALDYAHAEGLVHRDVKPENILFTSGQACLADFGIARAIERAIDESTTSTGLVRGTPAYMSPEQASGSRNYNGRSDQYSLACVLYEMLAGVPAFIGATPEAVIAMRFQHPPRELSVYRPTVPPAVTAVIDRALSLVPADRFERMGDFAAALDSALRAPIVESRTSGARGGAPGNRITIGAALTVAALILSGVYAVTSGRLKSSGAADSTRVAVFPFRDPAASERGVLPEELFSAGLRRWGGITVVPADQVTDAMRRRRVDAAALTPDARKEVATSLGAGRFVVGRIIQTPTGRAIAADLEDAKSGTLYSTQAELPNDPSRVAGTYAALADSLLLRGRTDGAPPGSTRPRQLFATQGFIRAMEARDDWNLMRSDSLLSVAIAADASYARAHLWRAQVRAWRQVDPELWVAGAQRALADSGALSSVERSMAHGLVLLAAGDYLAACRVYRQLVAADRRSFVGWYGMGECHMRDRAVVEDRASPSGWRFRSSLQQAVNAYATAFELIPATYRGFEAEGYSRLRELLYTSGRQLRTGTSLDTSRRVFLGAPILLHDTLALIAFDRADVLAGRARSGASPEAVARLRAVFDSITVRWASAFPSSAGAKEALALSLEQRGDPAALDTLLAAERLASDSAQRLRLTASRIALQVKFGVDMPALLDRARASADSLLERAPRASREERAILAPLAALTGRCRLASALLRDVAPALQTADLTIPRDLNADAHALLGYVATGCPIPDSLASPGAIAERIVLAAPTPRKRATAEYMLQGSVVRALYPLDSAAVMRMADVGGGLLAAERDFLIGRRDSARARLTAVVAPRAAALPGQITADVVVPEARLWLLLGDTTAALRSLASALSTVRYATPLASDQAAYNAGRLGFLVQALALHAQLAAATNRDAARKSALAVAKLWANADAPLQAQVSRLLPLIR